jgi:hypothetical protein
MLLLRLDWATGTGESLDHVQESPADALQAISCAVCNTFPTTLLHRGQRKDVAMSIFTSYCRRCRMTLNHMSTDM